MKTLIAVAAVFVVACIQVCQGELHDYEVCNGHKLHLAVEDKEKIKDCLEKAGGAKELKDVTQQYGGCFTKCRLEAFGALEKNGKPDEEKALEHFLHIFKKAPFWIKGKVKQDAKDCLKVFVTMQKWVIDFSKEDCTCSVYDGLYECWEEARNKMCNPKKE